MKGFRYSFLFALATFTASSFFVNEASALEYSEQQACIRGQRAAANAYKKAARFCDSSAKKKDRLHAKIFSDLAKWESTGSAIQAKIAAETNPKRKAMFQKQYDKKSQSHLSKHNKDMAKFATYDATATTACGATLQAAQSKVEEFSSCS